VVGSFRRGGEKEGREENLQQYHTSVRKKKKVPLPQVKARGKKHGGGTLICLGKRLPKALKLKGGVGGGSMGVSTASEGEASLEGAHKTKGRRRVACRTN